MPLDTFKEVIPALIKHKEQLVTAENEKEYNAFLVNRSLSYFSDSILYANEMNRWRDLDKKMQFDFYLHGIRTGFRRFQKWMKPGNEARVKFVAQQQKVSRKKASELLKIIPETMVDQYIKMMDDKGGVTKRTK